MARLAATLARLAWLLACIGALLTSYRDHASPLWEVEEGLYWAMMVLSFPASLLATAGFVLVGAGLRLFGLALPGPSIAEMTATWFLFLVVGYGQWFVGLPWLLKRQKRHRTDIES